MNAQTKLGFDGTWVGQEYFYKTFGTWPQAIRSRALGQPAFRPTFVILRNGALIGRVGGPAAGRFEHVVVRGRTLVFGAGNTSFELTLSNDGNTLEEKMQIVAANSEGECWIRGHYHRK